MPNPSPANLALLPADLSLDDLRLFCRVARLGTLSAVARERNVRAALSNAFAFGGTNAVLAFKAF